MKRGLAAAVAGIALALGACVPATAPQAVPVPTPAPAAPVEVQILAINDFHGNHEPPKLGIEAGTREASIRVPAGGVAYLAGAAAALRSGQPHSVTVSAGDLIGASPLVSALFLDEPTIAAMNLAGLEYNAVGNHEFDKGTAELTRMQRGGCEKYTSRQPCGLEPFAGARFGFLAANVLMPDGKTLFPPSAIKDFGPVQVGFIGMTLKETATIVPPAGVAGVTFADEAVTANALVPQLKAAGADAVVILLHQGGRSTGGYNDKSCPDFKGDILPILARLDPGIDLVISGHTHTAYICELPRAGARPLLLTSAGRFGTLISDIRLTFSADRRVVGARADNVIVQGEGYSTSLGAVPVVPAYPVYAPDPAVGALVGRYVTAAAPQAQRVVGKLAGSVTKLESVDREQTAGTFIADAFLATARKAGAQVALINSGGVRTDLVPGPGGEVTFGQIFAMQPFGNSIVVKTLTGAQLKRLLEQQFASGTNTAEKPVMLLPSEGFFFSYDLRRPPGDRIVEIRLNGRRINPAARYKVAVPNFLASGGDNLSVLPESADAVDMGPDLDALEAWLKTGARVPKLGRIKNLAPPPVAAKP
jgi:5'-nucleotidase